MRSLCTGHIIILCHFVSAEVIGFSTGAASFSAKRGNVANTRMLFYQITGIGPACKVDFERSWLANCRPNNVLPPPYLSYEWFTSFTGMCLVITRGVYSNHGTLLTQVGKVHSHGKASIKHVRIIIRKD